MVVVRSKCFALAAAVVASGGGLAGVSRAALLTIQNPSFETPVVTGNAANLTITGWGQGTDTGVINDGTNGGPFGPPTTAANGKQMAFLGNGTTFTNIFQDVAGAGVTGATSYTLTAAFAIRTGETPGTNGTINLGIQDLTGTGAINTTAISRSALTNTFQDFSVTLPSATVAAGDAIRIFTDKLAGNSLIVVDNYRLDAVGVPEPGTLGLLGLAAAGLLARRRRRTV